jgi:recombination protein RecA
MDKQGRDQALETALASIQKRFGEGAIMRLGDARHLEVDVIPTGSLALDIALGVGGMPRGRVIEVYGPESSGKTTLCQHVIAEAQQRGGLCAFIDMEHALDPAYASRCGVDVDNLYISQPDAGEQALEIAEALIRSGTMDVVVVDSVAALVPRAEIEGEMGDAHMGLQARLMSQALRKLSGVIKQTNTVVIFTNQLRMKMPGGDQRRQRSEVLRLGPHRPAPQPGSQDGRRGCGQPDASEGEEEQGGAALHRVRV